MTCPDRLRWPSLALAIGALVLLQPVPAAAAPGTAARRDHHLPAMRTSGPIKIDGTLDEPDWSQAPVASGFVQAEPHEGAPASEDTEVRILYDPDTLYLGVFARDAEPARIIVNELKRDFDDSKADSFGFVLDTFHDGRNGYMFSINAGAARLDAQMANEGREVNKNWDGLWTVATSITADGWYAEIAVPFRGLKFPNVDVQTWGINFQRRIRHRNEETYWAPIPRTYKLSRVSIAGTLDGLRDIRAGRNLRLKPYGLARLDVPGRGDPQGDGDGGLDVKYGVTTGLTWDITWNTDFSQVEADQQQVNLSRFSLFFPEKREFFLENSGMFQFGPGSERRTISGIDGAVAGRQSSGDNDLVLFFSRRIGLSSDGQPIPIRGGTRLTGRVGHYTLGALAIGQQARTPEDVATDGTTAFSAVRLRRDLFASSDAGLIFLERRDPGGRLNRVAGTDVNLRLFRNLTLGGLIARSDTAGVDSGEQTAGRVAGGWHDGLWDLRASWLTIGAGFDDQLGFVPRVGVNKSDLGAGLRIRPRAGRRWLREIYPHWQQQTVTHHGDGLDSRYADYHVVLLFQDGALFELGVNPSTEVLRAPFTINRRLGITIPAGRYDFTERFGVLMSNAAAPVAFTLRLAEGGFYGGTRRGVDAGATLRLNERFTVSTTLNRNVVTLPQGAFTTTLLTGRFNYSFSTRMFVNTLIQYNTETRQVASNVRFNLIHHPLSDIFLVYNDTRDSRSGAPINRTIVAKVTYMFAF